MLRPPLAAAGRLPQGAARAGGQGQGRQPGQPREQESESEKERRFRRLPAISLPSFPSLFSVKKPDASTAVEPDVVASPRALP